MKMNRPVSTRTSPASGIAGALALGALWALAHGECCAATEGAFENTPYREQAAQLAAKHDYAGAVKILRAGHEAMPNNLLIVADLARFLAASPDPEVRKPAEALRLAAIVSKVDPNIPEIIEATAAANAFNGNFDAAERTLKDALEAITEPTWRKTLAEELAAYHSHKLMALKPDEYVTTTTLPSGQLYKRNDEPYHPKGAIVNPPVKAKSSTDHEVYIGKSADGLTISGALHLDGIEIPLEKDRLTPNTMVVTKGYGRIPVTVRPFGSQYLLYISATQEASLRSLLKAHPQN